MNHNIKKLSSILVRILEIDEATVTDEMSPDTLEAWDSYNALMLVSELETSFNVHFTMDEVVAVKNVKDIKDTLRRHGVDI